MTALEKFAKDNKYDGGLKGQATLTSMLSNKGVKRNQYIRAGVKDEDSNIEKMRKQKSKFLGFSFSKYPVKNMINSTRKKMESKEHRNERFGKAYDRFRKSK